MAISKEEILKLTGGSQKGEDIYKASVEHGFSASDVDNAFGYEAGTASNWLQGNPQGNNSTPAPAGVATPGVAPTAQDRSTGDLTNPALTNPNETAIRQQQLNAATGNTQVPGADLQAVQTNMVGTITEQNQVQQVSGPGAVQAQTTGPAPVINAQTGGEAATAGQVQDIGTSTIDDVVEVQQQAATEAATGSISEQAIANVEFTPSEGVTAEAAEVEIPDGAHVEAVVGTMPPEALAEAAKVAGLDAARVDRAKQQLRQAGLTEDAINAFGNDPSALEMELTKFTEEQRGVIAGLPVEALVSTQMDQLLAGLETGEIPAWAKPATSAVESLLARRGLTASTVGRDSLMNAIIQAALPIAQMNADSIKQGALQQNQIIAEQSMQEAQMKQQAILQNAQNVFNLNIRNLDAEQQAALANSQFMQTVAITNANNRQQTAIQNAINLTQLDMATLDANTKIAVENAKSFLSMDLANLSNEQQAKMIDAQFEQQRLFSNASAQNAAKQFNAASENQTNQFMAGLKAQVDQFNASQLNAMKQFNATEQNKISAINAGNQIAVEQFNAQLMTQVAQFNAQMEAQVEQWNAANAQAIEQSNIQWRRQANTADTAAQNAINQQNVQNAFNLTAQAQASLWQELRDLATFTYQSHENAQDREAQLYASAIGNEAAASHNYDHTKYLVDMAKSFFGGPS